MYFLSFATVLIKEAPKSIQSWCAAEETTKELVVLSIFLPFLYSLWFLIEKASGIALVINTFSYLLFLLFFFFSLREENSSFVISKWLPRGFCRHRLKEKNFCVSIDGVWQKLWRFLWSSSVLYIKTKFFSLSLFFAPKRYSQDTFFK